ncbi:hypothetical protein HPB47_002073 [Ixodes persulcatus]|uniref:Uncharacterized protein n=1 Tax=Ixodes persulcatus TaxID=34615 RepID=A0AC60PM77_IXOPE|nr:hypothetical protein HPB47_002073 [Ixodes persulcatus]
MTCPTWRGTCTDYSSDVAVGELTSGGTMPSHDSPRTTWAWTYRRAPCGMPLLRTTLPINRCTSGAPADMPDPGFGGGLAEFPALPPSAVVPECFVHSGHGTVMVLAFKPQLKQLSHDAKASTVLVVWNKTIYHVKSRKGHRKAGALHPAHRHRSSALCCLFQMLPSCSTLWSWIEKPGKAKSAAFEDRIMERIRLEILQQMLMNAEAAHCAVF